MVGDAPRANRLNVAVAVPLNSGRADHVLVAHAGQLHAHPGDTAAIGAHEPLGAPGKAVQHAALPLVTS